MGTSATEVAFLLFPKDLQKQNGTAIIFQRKANCTKAKQVKMSIYTSQSSKIAKISFLIVNNTHLYHACNLLVIYCESINFANMKAKFHVVSKLAFNLRCAVLEYYNCILNWTLDYSSYLRCTIKIDDNSDGELK